MNRNPWSVTVKKFADADAEVEHILAKGVPQEESLFEQIQQNQGKDVQQISPEEGERRVPAMTETNSAAVSIPEKIARRLDDVRSLTLQIGAMQVDVPYMLNDSEDLVYMTDHLCRKTGLMPGLTCYVTVDDQRLKFGPVVGVLVSYNYIDRLLKKQHAKQRTLELMKANQQANTILYFFSVEDVICKQKQIVGTYYHDHEQCWKQRVFPMPDVLYVRGGGKYRRKSHHKYVRTYLDKMTTIKRLNARHYFDKWELYRRLSKYPEMRSYLPYTRLYKNEKDFQRFKNRKKVYVKRCVSSNGQKVMRVSRMGKNGYQYSYYANHVVEHKVKRFKDVLSAMKRYFHGTNVIIQEAINLQKVNQSIMDMRATVQRNGQGELEIVAIAARVGYKNSPVTSTRTGSACYKFEDFYRHYLGYSKSTISELKKQIEDFLRITYTSIERAYGPFGELGIDFAIDQNQKIWLIEGNAKPAKDALYKSYDKKTIRKAFQYPLEYAKHISGF